MKKKSVRFMAKAVFGALLVYGLSYTSITNAADGCGFGLHSTAFGRCVPNNPGPGASAIPGRPDCWTNVYGQVRCWR